ncbi:MAG: undecaprenyl-diphosphate phosphatase [Sulfolobales archaeon]|mgnify:CR=1 FL=1
MDPWHIMLGVVQGVVEWIPVSSKTVLMLISAYVLGYSLSESYSIGLALQGGTIVSAATYFWKTLISALWNKRILMFLIVSTLFTGLIGVPTYLFSRKALEESFNPGLPTIAIGLLLLTQALLAERAQTKNLKGIEAINLRDSILFGIVQGLAALPGVSRSGATVTLLLYLGYELSDAMRLSFLASILANAGATFAVYLLDRRVFTQVVLGSDILLVFLASAITGFFAISFLIDLARKYRIKMIYGMAIITILLGVLITLTKL